MQALFHLWVYNDRLASFVAFHVGTFSYLLDNIANNSTKQHQHALLSSFDSSSEEECL